MSKKIYIFLFVLIVLLSLTYLVLVKVFSIKPNSILPIDLKKKTTIAPFQSNQEFKDYIKKAGNYIGFTNALDFIDTRAMDATAKDQAPSTLAPDGLGSESSLDRFSSTNIQVLGIDEPDIVKNDGQNIYYAQKQSYYPVPLMMEDKVGIATPQRIEPSTKIIQALPLKELSLKGKINQEGDLLLADDKLIILANDQISAFDLSNQKEPAEIWNFEYDNTSLVSARLYKNLIYLVLKKSVNEYSQCPIDLGTVGKQKIQIDCVHIYHPVDPIYADTTYSFLVLDPADGSLQSKVSMLGSAQSSIVYMSPNALYLSYEKTPQLSNLLVQFFITDGKDLISADLLAHIKELDQYKISFNSKMNEINQALQEYFSSFTKEEQIKKQNDYANTWGDYLEKHKRDLYHTGIVKIEIDQGSLNMAANAEVPGRLLNQFALDEYQGNLRVAVTIGQSRSWRSQGEANIESANDILILDQDLKTIGQVQNLGLDERIYAVRFLGNLGYLVTFKETDPFYVLDLSDPKNPQRKGELKIPGYSAYLHPLKSNLILGLGKDGSQVKAALFDVSDPSNPQEVDKYVLDEYWSEILNNHHAFLQDAKHNIFFLPGSKAGYIFSYNNNKLNLEKALVGEKPERALYINDYLYFISPEKITVLNESNWEKVGELKLK